MKSLPHEKYLYKPFVGSSHDWASKILTTIPKNAVVLDVGPGSGAMGKLLSEQGISELYAVEPDASCREYVKEIYKSVEPDLSGLKNQKYDLILLLDVLEHMANPFEFFKKISSLLNTDGKILLSVPNIAHWSIRFSLLLGFFEYTDRGLLDRTHLQFFNRRRFNSLINSVPELKILETSATIEPVEFLLPETLWKNGIFIAVSKFRIALAKTFPGFFAFQHLAHLVKR